ncbi:amino acid transporter [Brachybacterium sp. P6-10-X1]|uniref:APC family permease n=1 Tax=Brachybacterium sp. P6-10-X1 TaxID=1903186 RepID=UPI000971B09E|nr:APC family permease [Brachybacterium sp. P6-10-X1]APX33928.1 amino acid transporter [Brachybacterium sp. P6-10-X1]
MAGQNAGLKRQLSLLSLVALAAGAVLGGWLAEAPYWFELTGAGAAIIFPILAVILVPIGLAFAELTSVLPFSSSVDVWSGNAMNSTTGWATQWLFFLVQVVEPPLVAFIFVTAAGFFVEVPVPVQPLIAIAIMVLWYIFSNFSIELTGVMAIVLFIAMVTITVGTSIYYFSSGHWEFTNISEHGGFFPHGISGAVAAASALVLKYIGFAMTPTMIQETTFAAKKMVIVILAGLFIPAVVYMLATVAIGGLAPHDVIAGLSVPEPELVDQLGMPAIIGLLAIAAGLLYAFTTLMGFWTSSARVLFGASQLRQLPPWFSRTNRYGQPYVANLVVLAFGIFFAAFTSTNWVQYTYSLSVVAAGAVYFLGCLSAYRLRTKHPEWTRPFRAPAGKPMFVVGMVISAAITVVGVTLLPANAWPPIIAYLVIGALVPLAMRSYRSRVDPDYTPIILGPEDVEAVEQRQRNPHA